MAKIKTLSPWSATAEYLHHSTLPVEVEWTHSGAQLTGFLDNNYETTKWAKNYTLSYLHHREVKTKVPLLKAVSYDRKRKEKQEKQTM